MKIAEVKNACYNVGDELIMSGVCKILKQNDFYVKLFLKRHPELFENNINVDQIVFEPWKDEDLKENKMLDVLNLNEYVKTFDIDIPYKITPEMYLSKEEIQFGIEEIKKIKDDRIIVCFVPHSATSPASLSNGWDKIVFDKDLLKEIQFVYFGQEKYEGMKNFNKFNIRQIASIIRCCNLYMGINTGLYHIAKCFKLKGFIVNRKICKEHWGYNDDFHFENFSSSDDFLQEFKKEYKNFVKDATC